MELLHELLQHLHDSSLAAQRDAEAAAARFHAAIAEALSSGASATEIARALGVSRGRVYQWRDKAS